MQKDNKIVMYQGTNGEVELRADVEKDTIWASQAQVAEIFSVDTRTVNEHIHNIFSEGELAKQTTIRNFRIVQKEGSRTVRRDTKCYSLDMIIAVGYRVNSKKATQFRIWATRILREYLVKGYGLNMKKLEGSPESLIGLYDAITMIEAEDKPGKLKGKITIKLTKDLIER